MLLRPGDIISHDAEYIVLLLLPGLAALGRA